MNCYLEYKRYWANLATTKTSEELMLEFEKDIKLQKPKKKSLTQREIQINKLSPAVKERAIALDKLMANLLQNKKDKKDEETIK
jgi:hypothetical protein